MRSAPALLILVTACAIENRTPAPAPPPPPASSAAKLIFPDESEIPDGPEGAAIRRGLAIVSNVRDSLPGLTRSDLNCTSCHLDNGTRAWAAPFVGVYGRFPQYRSRNDRVNILEDRINDCFERSLNGKALPREGREMREIVAYLAFLSRGVAPPGDIPGIGVRTLEPLRPDTAQGQAIFAETCSRCHGNDGAGTALAPPLWGPRGFNVGAGMARLRTAAAFIRDNMPNDRAVVLTDQHAYDVAAYVLSRPRPDFARKGEDWPNGDPPPDVAYSTRAATLKASGSRPKP